VYWIGLLSGTSADGVDAALVRTGPRAADLRVAAFCTVPFEESLRKWIHDLIAGHVALREVARLDVELGGRFADAALEVIRQSGVPQSEIVGIGSHGQTVGHFPEADVRASLQLGTASVIHERTGLPVISDFRRADMAAGGQGAPLTPFFHHAYFATHAESRAVLNVGGFTNVTYLPTERPEDVIAFDPGPGNALIDRAVRWASRGAARFDRDGERAARGAVDREVLESLLGDAYFSQPPPKSTGHERFGGQLFESTRDRILGRGGSADDVVATLTDLTVESVALSAERFFPEPPQRWIVYGGGAFNATLVERLRRRLAPAPIEATDGYGIPAEALEAVAFAFLGWTSSRGEPSSLPQVTGASRGVVLGVQTPPGCFGGPRG
jgi:anhydro-N-acetylmuramic acid kinase